MLVTRNTPIQSVAGHPVEWWTDRNGRKWQRATLGDVAAGSLILGVVRSYGVDVLWRGRNTPKRALFSDALEELLQDSCERMSRKTGRHQVHRVAGRANGDVGMWWLALLPLVPPGWRAGTSFSPYMIESRLAAGPSFSSCCRRRFGAQRARLSASNFRKLPQMSDDYEPSLVTDTAESGAARLSERVIISYHAAGHSLAFCHHGVPFTVVCHLPGERIRWRAHAAAPCPRRSWCRLPWAGGIEPGTACRGSLDHPARPLARILHVRVIAPQRDPDPHRFIPLAVPTATSAGP